MAMLMRFWRGELGFLWVFFLVLGASFLMTALSNRVALWAVLPFVGLLGILSLMQVIGAVRFSERVLKDGALSRVYGAYAAMSVAVIANVVCALGLLLPKPEVSLEVEGFAPKVILVGDVAEVSGAIDYQILTELKAAVESVDLRVVRLQSNGGNVIAGRSIGLFIGRQGLNTEVLGNCFSACTLAFVGGVKRHLGPEGALGFHGYRIDSTNRVQTVDWRGVIAKDRVYLAVQGVDSAFVDRIFETPPEALWQPDRARLEAAGILRY